jgi:hypothetical protein
LDLLYEFEREPVSKDKLQPGKNFADLGVCYCWQAIRTELRHINILIWPTLIYFVAGTIWAIKRDKAK